MLKLLRWGLGSGHDSLTEKERIQEEERCRARAMPAMNPGNGASKRKRGKGSQSVALPPRPAKRSPQYLSHVEVPSAKNGSAGEATASNFNSFLRNGDLDSSATMASDKMEADANAPNGTLERQERSTSGLSISMSKTDRAAKLRQVIETEFDLEILLKHNELRLIDQEIAKCQVALEQLRRCSVIPYPATTSNPHDMLNVSNGTGIPQPGLPGVPPAEQPPPWGVADGPYSRHYAQWLLPDRTFDGGFPEEVVQPHRAGKTLPERHTRGVKADKTVITPKARTHRGSHARLQALPVGYPEPKEDKGPMILKRASDGKLVKLVCPNCHRENFNSAQGFINHCRIAHSHNLASHEVAARECGVEIDPSEIIQPTESATPQSAHPYNPAATLVHPLIRGGMVSRVPTLSVPSPKARPAAEPAPSATQSKKQPNAKAKVDTAFKASPQVPHLSALFAKLQHTTDLPLAVEDATTKEDLQVFEEESSDSNAEEGSDTEMEDAPALAPASMSRAPSRISTRGGPTNSTLATGNGRPKSHKGLERAVATSRRPGSSYRATAPSQPAARQPPSPSANINAQVITIPDDPTPQTHSPQTAESNIAPSLVSDSEEDGDYKANASESSSASPSSEEEGTENEDGEDVVVDTNTDVEMHDDGDGDSDSPHPDRRPRGGGQVSTRRGQGNKASSSADPELRASSKARTPVTRRKGNRGAKEAAPRRQVEVQKEPESEVQAPEILSKGRGGRRAAGRPTAAGGARRRR